MKILRLIMMNLVVLIMVFAYTVSSHAALVDNGDGTITDTDYGIMWLKDANYAFTSGYDTDGLMSWQESIDWADSLVVAGYDDWVLPASDSCTGLNCTNSEMGHLYYDELGNPADGPMSNTGPFDNLMAVSYWSGTDMDATYAWDFRFHRGLQVNYVFKSSDHLATAVRDITGVPVVPEPVSSILFIVGGTFLGIRLYSRKKRLN